MNLKKIMAWLLLVVMVTNLIPIQVFANDALKPLDGTIEITVLNSQSQNTEEITPDIEVKWKPGDTSSVIVGDITYEFGHYQIRLTDLVEKKSYLSESITGTTVKLQNIRFGYDLSGSKPSGTAYTIENGKAYKLEVIPVYKYKISKPDGTQETRFDIASAPPQSLYFITDFDTRMQDTEEGLTLTWEYIPGADYELAYTLADKKTVGEFGEGVSGNIPIIRDTVTQQIAEKNLVVEDGKTRVKYTINPTVPGQIYSAYVVVKQYKTGESLKKPILNVTEAAKGPKVVKGIPAIEIRINNIGNKRIKISWKFQSWVGLDGSLQKIVVFGKGIDENIFTPKLEVPALNNTTIESVILDEPQKETFYYMDFVFKDTAGKPYTIRSKMVLYTPFVLREEPLKPNIPKPYADYMKEEPEFNKNNYLVTGDQSRPSTDPKFKENTFHSKVKEGEGIQVVWDVPKRQVNGQSTIDYKLQYDVWITDDKNMIENSIKPTYENIQIEEGDIIHTILDWDNKKPVGFKWKFKEYMTVSGRVEPIKVNKTYYIKIVAKRPYGSDFAVSQPSTVSITIDKNGDIARPPVLGKPPLQIDHTTTETATIKWREEWYEILAKDLAMYSNPDEKTLAQMGSGRVYLEEPVATTGAAIRFKYETGRKEYILYQLDHVNAVKEKVGNERYGRDYYHRKLSLGKEVSYEMQVLPYNDVLGQLGTGESIEEWVAKQGATEGWTPIAPINGDGENKDWKYHTVEKLQPNTKYMMMIRAFRIVDGEKLSQTFPSYVIATTLSDFEKPEPIPKVPELHFNQKTDTTLGVWFTYNKDFDYEIVYSKLDDPNTALVWDFKISDDPQSKDYIPNGGKAIITINGLFPDSTYNVWIRAKQKKGKEVSAWSNPVTAKTDTIMAPKVPSGLGTAASQSIADIGLDFKPVGKDYITVEWTKDPNDKGTEVEGDMEKRYEYVLEFSDNVEFLDATSVTVSDKKEGATTNKDIEILAKNMVKFNKLISNRPYYVRIRARIILTDQESKREISKESDFSKSVRILTKKSDDEYDGGENDNIVIYPEAIEESYQNGTWTWEIIDAQRIISEIVTKKDYFLTVDMTLYRGNNDALVRKVRLPKAVWDALIGQRMELKVLTSYGVYQIPASTVAYATEKMNAKQMIELEFSKVFLYDVMAIAKPYPYSLQKGEKLSIWLEGRMEPVQKLDGMMRTELKLDGKDDYLYKNIQGHTYDQQSGNWVKEASSIQTRADGTYLGFSTPRLGIYGLYNVADYTPPSGASMSMTNLLKQYDMIGLGSQYRSYDSVSSDQYILMMLGIAQNKETIDLNTYVSREIKEKAKTSKLYVSNSSGLITQEQAISGVVRLYELKTGYKVKPSNRNVSAVSPAYRESVAKAYAIGLIEDIDAGSSVSYSELCDWIVQVLP